MIELEHAAIQELLGAFALDALDTAEADAVELHLRECPRCRAEVGAFREAAAQLAFAGEEPPPGVWDRIVASLEEPPPRLELARVTAAPVPAWRRLGMRVVALAAVVISVAALGVALEARRSDSGTSVAQALNEWTLDPATRIVHMESGDTDTTAEILLLGGQGWLAKDTLPKLPEDETYQLWGLKDETVVSLGVLGDDPELFRFAADADYDSLAITAEKRPGVASSQKAAVVVGFVPLS